jgi:ribosome-associated toxin RatA of RatAB toxin-antitoxin module
VRSVVMKATIPGRDAREVFDLLCRLERYPEASSAILDVRVDRGGPVARSTWHVRFREGVLVWTERDEIDAEALELRFEQVEGDFEHLAGRWRIVPTPGGCAIDLDVAFDFGIPSLAHFIDPLAERALYDQGVELIEGLLGAGVELETSRPAGGELELPGWA